MLKWLMGLLGDKRPATNADAQTTVEEQKKDEPAIPVKDYELTRQEVRRRIAAGKLRRR